MEILNIFRLWGAPDMAAQTQRDYVNLAKMYVILYGRCHLTNIVTNIFRSFQIVAPKNRGVALTGTFDCGKTTLAGGFKDLFKGVTIKIDLNDDTSRTFQLGMAMGRRYVMFDDVREVGIKVLDNSLRDYIDGHHDVILERKNKDPVEQRFPPGIITSNITHYPESLTRRIKFFNIVGSPEVYQAHETYMDRFISR